jgi:hypothetical protein
LETAELFGDAQLAKLTAPMVTAPTVIAARQRRERKRGFNGTVEKSTETD